MRTRKEIETDHREYDVLTLEVLLDIRDLVIALQPITIAQEVKAIPKMGKIIPEKNPYKGKPRGRPRRIK